ncbi:MAG: sigma-54 dependent transcriptional regulator [Gammaproteobacteria bacterium]|nr:sigma-54 dependent transcriptional regulator [Gammaproteobacteria bacterium]
MNSRRILVIDDEADIRDLVSLTLTDAGLTAIEAENLAEAHRAMAGKDIDLVLTDMRLPDGDGIEFVSWMQTNAPGIPVAVITAYGNVETAVNALKAGAFDFINKPLDLERLRQVVASALRLENNDADVAGKTPQLLGEAPTMHALRALITRVGRSEAPVLITGESGTGKELAARLVHAASVRANSPFLPVNCGAIPSELMESELFGHRKGSFTGAVADRAGLIASADGGTVFLDEIAELPPAMQVKLLRVLQERKVRPIGSTEEIDVDVRFLSATHSDLEERISENRFREDLFYRIDVIRLAMPPLRERPEDIPLLAEHILARMAGEADAPPLALDPEALALIQAHPFPGNVRELENILERALAFSSGGIIKAEDIRIRRSERAQRPEADGNNQPLPERVEAIQREEIEKTLREAGGNQSEAARRLGMTARQLRYRIAKLGIKS